MMDREHLLEVVTSAARVGLVVVSPEYRYLFANDAYAGIFGLASGQIVGQSVREVLPTAWLQIQPRLDRALQGESVRYELTLPPVGEGEPGRHFVVRYEPHMETSGERSVVVVVVDVTDQRRVEAAIREQRLRLAGIVDSAMDAIISIDEEQRIVLLNPAAERMFRCASADVLGGSIDRFLPARLRVSHGRDIETFGRSGIAARSMGHHGPMHGVRADGEEFPIEASISQVVIDGQRLFTVICRDVTERAREADARRVLEAQLHQSQKMEAFGQLAGGVAHDFNNLLTVISGYCDLLLHVPARDAEDREMLHEILTAGHRASSLTRQLLAFSRQQVLEPRLVDLNAVIGDVDRMLRRLIGEDVQLTTLLLPGLSAVKVDPRQIEQVVMNLAVNARDAMPDGGQLTIETGEVELDDAYASTHPEVRPGRYVRLAMSDTGSGMTEEVRRRLFEPFFTTKGVGRGTGLGLAVVHGIIRQSGGSVAVYSEVGIGTTFAIHLPVSADGSAAEREEVTLPPPMGHETILLVEDDARVLEFAARVLRDCGYRLLTAADGNAALRIAAVEVAPIDLLITDVVMPGPSGRQTAEALTAARPGLRVLFVSGYTDDAIVRHGILQATVEYLQKPFSPGALARKVREVLDAPRPGAS